MKVFRILTLILTITLGINFSSCSKDDDLASIEGTWGLVKEVGYEKDPGYLDDEWDDVYNPSSPSDYDVKLTFVSTGNNEYVVTVYRWSGSEWKKKGDYKCAVKNGTISYNDEYEDISMKIVELTSSKLVLEEKNQDDSHSYYNVSTYKKLD